MERLGLLHIIAMVMLALCFISHLQASHFLGGEIRYTPTGALNTYAIQVDLYADLSSPADRPEIIVDLGDGTMDTIPRILIVDDWTGGNCGPVRLNSYQVIHTYPGPGNYTIQFMDQNRNGGIINIPNSISQAVCVPAVLVIDPELGPNTSLVFDSLLYLTHRNWNTLIHDPGAFDADGDSLAFELVAPAGWDCEPIQGYETPTGTNFAWLDPSTGTFSWDYPPFNGEYNLTIRGSEYRNGQLIGQVTRDMTICVAGFIAGIDERGSARLNISPSIASDQVRIENPGFDRMELEIHNAQGALAGTWNLDPGVSVVDLQRLPSGAYFVTATSATGQRSTGRVLKR